VDKSPLDGWVMVICNPISGAGHGLTILKSVRRTLDHAGVTNTHEVSSGRGDVARLARSAVLSG
jgi:diacylglycerol kinase family enzyme